MAKKDWLTKAVEVIGEEATQKYRIDVATAQKIVRETLEKLPKLLKILDKAEAWKDVERSKQYKAAVSTARKKIYYHLRQYKQDPDILGNLVREMSAGNVSDNLLLRIAETHASTRERIPSRAAFYGQLSELTGPAAQVLDLGCGLQPLLWPFGGPFGPTAHLEALDKDQQSIDVLLEFARQQPALHAGKWYLSEGLKGLQLPAYDLALMLKLVPVLTRQAKDDLPLLYPIPARYWAISGSKISLTKNKSIEYRERKAIDWFLQQAGKKIIGEFDAGEEFVVVAE